MLPIYNVASNKRVTVSPCFIFLATFFAYQRKETYIAQDASYSFTTYKDLKGYFGVIHSRSDDALGRGVDVVASHYVKD